MVLLDKRIELFLLVPYTLPNARQTYLILLKKIIFCRRRRRFIRERVADELKLTFHNSNYIATDIIAIPIWKQNKMTNLRVNILDCAAEHPAIIAIAVDLILYPEHRNRYPALVLEVADRSIAIIRSRLMQSTLAYA